MMKVSVLQENLKAGLSLAGRAAAGRSTLPVLSNVAIQAQGEWLTLSSTNLEMFVSVRIGSRIEEEGGVTVPYRLLAELVSALPADRIEMSLTKSGESLRISCAGNVSTLRTIALDEFPASPAFEEAQVVSLPALGLLEMIEAVAYAAATKEDRPALLGVLVRGEGAQLTLTATDGFRLSAYTRDLPEPLEQPFELLLPARTLRELRHFLPAQEGVMVHLAHSPSHARFTTDQSTSVVYTSLIEGRFPDYTRLIPQAFAATVHLDRSEIQHASKLGHVFSRHATDAIALEIVPTDNGQPRALSIAGEAGEIGANRAQVPADVQGDPLAIWVNGQYLDDALDALAGSPTVCLKIAAKDRPVLIGAEDKPGLVQLIMPVADARGGGAV